MVKAGRILFELDVLYNSQHTRCHFKMSTNKNTEKCRNDDDEIKIKAVFSAVVYVCL